MQMLPLLLKSGKIFIGGDMEAKFRAVTQGMAIQSLTHTWPISIQPTKLDKIDEAKNFKQKWTGYRSPLRDTSRACPIQRSMLSANHRTENCPPSEELEEVMKELKDLATPLKTMPTSQSFQGLNHYQKTIHGLTQGSAYVAENRLFGAPVGGKALGFAKIGFPMLWNMGESNKGDV